MKKNNEEINKLNDRIGELEIGWKRTQADFDNYRKRIEQEKIEWKKFANLDLILNILPILDNFERASKHVPTELKDNNWVQGVSFIENSLEEVLKSQGLEKINVHIGDKFDPNTSEAINCEPQKGFKTDQIFEVIESGYKLGDRVIKPVKVKVCK